MEDLFKPLYKAQRRAPIGEITYVFDPTNPLDQVKHYNIECTVNTSDLHKAYDAYGLSPPTSYSVYSSPQLPGLDIISGIITPELQKVLVAEAAVDYLADPRHKTNLDAHHTVARPTKLFASQEDYENCPTMTNDKIKNTSLRWVTLGGQYNWTTKVYPSFTPGSDGWPPFPEKLASFIKNAFQINAEAAIVNYYTEGDILSPHKDEAELSMSPLVSISLGCDCIFYAGLERYNTEPLAIHLRSGDVVVMSGDARYAYHGVGRVFNNTSPSYLESSLSEPGFTEWINKKRININIRQMVDPNSV